MLQTEELNQLTLGRMFEILEVLESTNPFYRYYLVGLDKKGEVYAWRHLTIVDIPEYLQKLDQIPKRSATSWQQYQKAIKDLVVRAVDNQICQLPEGWHIHTNSRGYRSLRNASWGTGRLKYMKGKRRLPKKYYGYSPEGLARFRLLSVISSCSETANVKNTLREEVMQLSIEDLLIKEKEWNNLQQAKKALRKCKQSLKIVRKDSRTRCSAQGMGSTPPMTSQS